MHTAYGTVWSFVLKLDKKQSGKKVYQFWTLMKGKRALEASVHIFWMPEELLYVVCRAHVRPARRPACNLASDVWKHMYHLLFINVEYMVCTLANCFRRVRNWYTFGVLRFVMRSETLLKVLVYSKSCKFQVKCTPTAIQNGVSLYFALEPMTRYESKQRHSASFPVLAHIPSSFPVSRGVLGTYTSSVSKIMKQTQGPDRPIWWYELFRKQETSVTLSRSLFEFRRLGIAGLHKSHGSL